MILLQKNGDISGRSALTFDASRDEATSATPKDKAGMDNKKG